MYIYSTPILLLVLKLLEVITMAGDVLKYNMIVRVNHTLEGFNIDRE